MKKFLILIIVFTMCFSFMNVMADTPYSLSLSAPEYVFYGQKFEADILVDTSKNEISIINFYITYDPTIFEFTSYKSSIIPEDSILIEKVGEGKLRCTSLYFKTYENDVVATLSFKSISEKVAAPIISCVSRYNDEWVFMDYQFNIIPEEQISFGSTKINNNCHYSSEIASFIYYKDHTLIHITPKNELLDKKIFITFYNDNIICDIKVLTCSDTSESFISYANYNKIKIMISHNTASTFPMYCHETIEY